MSSMEISISNLSAWVIQLKKIGWSMCTSFLIRILILDGSVQLKITSMAKISKFILAQ